MNKQDRGVIKWAPFNSLVGQRQMIENLINEKNKIKKPKTTPMLIFISLDLVFLSTDLFIIKNISYLTFSFYVFIISKFT